jgi:hypothetical protein
LFLAVGVVALLGIAAPAIGQDAEREAIVVVMDGASLPDLLADPVLRSFAAKGGAALMNGRSDVRDAFTDTFFPQRAVGRFPFPYTDIGTASAADAVSLVTEDLGGVAAPTLVIVVSTSPSAASAADGDEQGTVIAAWGDPNELLNADGPPRALTSDSTRRPGVVADVDPAATVAEWLDLPSEAGAPMERTGEPAPLDLYERYLQQRRLAVPAAAASWGLMLVFGLVGVLALAFRRHVSSRVLAVAGALAGSLPWLALGLLLVGHLPSLIAATAAPFLVAIMVAGVVFTRWVQARRGIFVALAACGGVILGILAIEAALGWPAAVTPLAGGGQLDGGRFFGMPNVEIGIVLGSAMFAVHRLRVGTGVLLLIACAVVAGSPWTGSNFGAAITMFAAAGMWLAIRRRRRWWIVVLITGAITAVGMAGIAVMHRYLTERPTHITAFLEHTSSVSGVLDRLSGRLEIGFDQLVDTPLAAIPVVGTFLLLVLVLRPPPAIARSFEGHDAWRDAVLVILLGSIVAYLANDTGAAALGFGFGFALSGLLDVSLATARRMMAR